MDSAQLDKVLTEFKKLEKAADGSMFAGAGNMSLQAAAHATRVAHNISNRAGEVGYRLPQELTQNTYGPMASLISSGGVSGSSKRKNSAVATETMNQYVTAVMEPLRAIQSIASLSHTREELRAVQENYPELFRELQRNTVEALTQNPTKGGISPEMEAKLMTILGQPLSLATSPEFAKDLGMFIASDPSTSGEGGNERAGNPRVTDSSEIPDVSAEFGVMTEAIERN
jgi:hypothetical protein